MSSKRGDTISLGVVAGDPLAASVLATWRALELTLGAPGAGEAVSDVLGLDPRCVAATLRRCEVAGLLVDGGITPAAEAFVEDRLARGRPA